MTYELRYGDDHYTIDMDAQAARVLDLVLDVARGAGLRCGLVFKSSPPDTDPLTMAHQTGVEATLRARIATLEAGVRAQATTIDELQREVEIHRGNSGHFEARYKEEQGRANGLEQFKRDHPPASINYIRDKFEKACTATTEETLLRAYLTLLLDIIKGAHHV